MQAFRVIFLVACLAGIASAASWPQDPKLCEEFKKVIEGLQRDIPKIERQLLAECNGLVNKEELDKCIATNMEMIDELKKETAETICQQTNLCPPKRDLFSLARQTIDNLVGHFQEKSQGETSPICDKCKKYVDEMKKRLPEVEKQLLDSCSKFPTKEMQQKCVEDAKAFLDYLSKHTSEKICHDDHLCSRKMVSFNLAQLQQPMCSLLCEPCKQLAGQLKAGAPQAKDKLKRLCKNCGASENVQKCEKAIDSFIENIEKKSPEELCTEIGLCKKQ